MKFKKLKKQMGLSLEIDLSEFTQEERSKIVKAINDATVLREVGNKRRFTIFRASDPAVVHAVQKKALECSPMHHNVKTMPTLTDYALEIHRDADKLLKATSSREVVNTTNRDHVLNIAGHCYMYLKMNGVPYEPLDNKWVV